jgi:hypothetical protein
MKLHYLRGDFKPGIPSVFAILTVLGLLSVGSLKFAAGGYKANGVLFADSSGVASSTSRVTIDGNTGGLTWTNATGSNLTLNGGFVVSSTTGIPLGATGLNASTILTIDDANYDSNLVFNNSSILGSLGFTNYISEAGLAGSRAEVYTFAQVSSSAIGWESEPSEAIVAGLAHPNPAIAKYWVGKDPTGYMSIFSSFGPYSYADSNKKDIGGSGLAMRNIYASGTGYIANLESTGILFSKATGTHTTSTNMYATTYRGGSYYGDGYFANTNGTTNLGSALNSFANIYSSGTVFGVNATYTGTVQQGSFVTQSDAGYIQAWQSLIAGSATGVQQGGYFMAGNVPVFGFRCLSDGAGGCIASSTAMVVNVPIVQPPMATSTMMVSTGTQFLVDDAYGIYNLVASGTAPVTPSQIVATGTAQTLATTCVEFVGTDDTRTVTIYDSAYIHLAGGVSMVLGDGDSLTLCSMMSRGYWRERYRSDN